MQRMLKSRVCFLTIMIIILAYSERIISQQSTDFPTIGKIVRHENRINDLIPPDAKIELPASGFEWPEDPLWVQDAGGKGLVYFDDIRRTTAGEIIYVDADATGANDGSSWADGYNYLQDALAVAISGDEIRAAQGIYKPDQSGSNTLGDRTPASSQRTGRNG